ncbi:hypothetical protein EDB84DRAFT_1460719 [Lactarius hengduanensis]|nr:hypothetical protein EDB84DRAFT_1460719 [Lactarius hengduanensis]
MFVCSDSCRGVKIRSLPLSPFRFTSCAPEPTPLGPIVYHCKQCSSLGHHYTILGIDSIDSSCSSIHALQTKVYLAFAPFPSHPLKVSGISSPLLKFDLISLFCSYLDTQRPKDPASVVALKHRMPRKSSASNTSTSEADASGPKANYELTKPYGTHA